MMWSETPSLKRCFSSDASEAKDLLELETTDCYVLVLTIVHLHLTFKMLQFATVQAVSLEVVLD